MVKVTLFFILYRKLIIYVFLHIYLYVCMFKTTFMMFIMKSDKDKAVNLYYEKKICYPQWDLNLVPRNLL